MHSVRDGAALTRWLDYARDVAPATEDELISLIAEDPVSDGPRLVLADFYLERQDPRGELMTIQLAQAPLRGHKRRLQQLIRSERVRMLGSLADVIDLKSVQFARGRLAACRTMFRTNAQRIAARDNPLWATVTNLVTDDAALVADPMMRSLEVVRGLGINAFAAVCRTDAPLTIQELWLGLSYQWAGCLEDRAAIGTARCLPRLRRLGLEMGGSEPISATHLQWLLASPLGQQLDELAIRASPPIDMASFSAFQRTWPRPLRFVLGDKVIDSRRPA